MYLNLSIERNSPHKLKFMWPVGPCYPHLLDSKVMCVALCCPCEVPACHLTTICNVNMGKISTFVNNYPLPLIMNSANSTLDGSKVNNHKFSGSQELPEAIFIHGSIAVFYCSKEKCIWFVEMELGRWRNCQGHSALVPAQRLSTVGVSRPRQPTLQEDSTRLSLYERRG